MWKNLAFLLLPLSLLAVNAKVLLISDTYVLEQQLESGVGLGHIFEMIPLGYSPDTDSITQIRLIYDFTEIYTETNQGDWDEVIDSEDNEILVEDEFMIFGSWLFIWREVYPDVDTGLTVFERDWERNEMCQLIGDTVPSGDFTGYCLLNVDLFGNINFWIIPYTNNLWLHSVTAEIEVDRKIDVPQPNSILMLSIGLLAVGFLRRRYAQHRSSLL